jgi:hypothetical protein
MISSMAVSPQQQILGTLAVPYPAGREPTVTNADLARVEVRGAEKATVHS